MIFAYLLCIICGLIIGSLQIVRRRVLSALGWFAINPLHDDGTLESGQAFLLLLLGLPILAAVFYNNPWVMVDNFVAGREGLLVVQFSIFKLITFLFFVCVGEAAAAYYRSYKFLKKQSQYQKHARSKPEYKYTSNMDEWINWRRSRAGSAHPDWTPPDPHQAKSQSSNTAYIDPKRRHALQILNMPNGATAKDIHRQYLKLAKQYHPDKFMMMPDSAPDLKRAEEKMKDINAAYEWLENNP